MVDVIEHVLDAPATAAELQRLLRPGGVVILTTPCANRGSAAWIYNRLLGRLRGDARRDRALRHRRAGPPAAPAQPRGPRAARRRRPRARGAALLGPRRDARSAISFERLSLAFRRRLAMLDWKLFRRLPNGGAMVLRRAQAREGRDVAERHPRPHARAAPRSRKVGEAGAARGRRLRPRRARARPPAARRAAALGRDRRRRRARLEPDQRRLPALDRAAAAAGRVLAARHPLLGPADHQRAGALAAGAGRARRRPRFRRPATSRPPGRCSSTACARSRAGAGS